MRVTQQKKRRNFPHRTHSLLHFMEFQFWTRGKNNYVCHIHLGTNEINHKRFVALLFFCPRWLVGAILVQNDETD